MPAAQHHEEFDASQSTLETSGSRFLARLLGIDQYDLRAEQCEIRNGMWIICVSARYQQTLCAKCGSPHLRKHGRFARIIAHIPVGAMRTQLHVIMQRQKCTNCGMTSSPQLPGIDFGHKISRELRQYLIFKYRTRHTFAQIAAETGLSERTVARIVKEEIENIDQQRSQSLLLPSAVGIDDFRAHSGEDGIYTHVVDLTSGATIELMQGTSAQVVDRFFSRSINSDSVRSFCSDGAAQYINAGAEYFPYSTRTLNRYHIVGYLLEGLDSVARSKSRVNEDTERPQVAE